MLKINASASINLWAHVSWCFCGHFEAGQQFNTTLHVCQWSPKKEAFYRFGFPHCSAFKRMSDALRKHRKRKTQRGRERSTCQRCFIYSCQFFFFPSPECRFTELDILLFMLRLFSIFGVRINYCYCCLWGNSQMLSLRINRSILTVWQKCGNDFKHGLLKVVMI